MAINRRNFLKKAINTTAGAALIAGATLPRKMNEHNVKGEVLELTASEAEVPVSLARRSPLIFEPWGISSRALDPQVARAVIQELGKQLGRRNITSREFYETSHAIMRLM